MGGYGKGKLNIHTAGISFYRRVNELLHLSKVNDIIKLILDFRFCHAKNGAVHIYVFPPGQLRMETSAHLQHAGDPAVVGDPPFCRPSYAGQQLEKRRLSRTIVPDDSDSLSLFYGKAYIV